MSANIKNSITGNYYSGGFAEIVPTPSILSHSFLAEWFTGKGSLGRAMKLLQLPFQEVNLHLLDLKNNELLVNLENEEQTLYRNTIFRYKNQQDIHSTPALAVDLAKVINPLHLINTMRIVLIQSKWIASPHETEKIAQKFVDSIPDEKIGTNIREIDELLKEKVWPNVIAIGLMSEFYNQLIIKEAKENLTKINKYIGSMMAENDWFFCSITEQVDVKNKKMSFTEFINKYGLRADKDYELLSPRWYEIQDIMKKRIDNTSDKKVVQNVDLHVDKKIQLYIDASIKLQLLRSESKRKTLIHMDNLRKAILQTTKGIADISHITRDQLITGNFPIESQTKYSEIHKKIKNSTPIKSNKGISVSQGRAKGLVKNIMDTDTIIPKGTIGIFPNASPELAIQYPKCEGMIFLKGGQTSHGAIVAREFGIPAIIDSNAEDVVDNSEIELNGDTGEWHIL